MSNDDLAVTLAILRIIRRWSQSQLAEVAGVTNSAISDYERGKVDPQSQTLKKLVRAFGLPLSALDQTQEFILKMRAQMDVGSGEDAPGNPDLHSSGVSTPDPRKVEIAQVAAEGGRFASRLTRRMLELLAARSEKRG